MCETNEVGIGQLNDKYMFVLSRISELLSKCEIRHLTYKND